MLNIEDNKLKDILIDAGVITSPDFEKLAKEAKRLHKKMADILVEQGVIHDNELGQLIADAYEYKFVNLLDYNIPKNTLDLISESVARNHRAVVFDKNEKGISMAFANPTNFEFINNLKKEFDVPVNIFFATEKDISRALDGYHKGLESDFNALLVENSEKAKKAKPDDPPVVQLVELLFSYAYENRASDIHIEPLDDEVTVRFRVDGILHEVGRYPKNIHELLVTRIKIMAKLRIDEHRSAQDGRLAYTPKVVGAEPTDAEEIDIRVSIVPITNGEKVVMRLLSARGQEFVLKDLGIKKQDLDKIKRNMKRSHGMILATGPTGSGKTTTLYAILKELNTENVNIATIEDPVEYEISGVNQIQVNPKTNLTFASGLRAILRQDPDIVMVGEIRDNETAGIAVNSAMTGHLVLSSLHTNDAATTLPRLIDMSIEPFLIASTVNVVIAQRLVRHICMHCRESYLMSAKEIKFLKEEPMLEGLFKSVAKKSQTDVTLYRGKGCQLCHNVGYMGRIGIFETLEISESIRELIMNRVNAEQIKNQAVKEGMTTLIENGIHAVLEGNTTIEEILRIIRE
ncbi:MAG: GspE/PulE family protein [Patescibacteria group bacterium]